MFIRPGSEKSCLSGLGRRKIGLRKAVYQAWVGERLFIRPGLEKSCLSGLARRKVSLRKVVYPAGVGEKLVWEKMFIRPRSEKSWSEKSFFIRPGLQRSWSEKSCLSDSGKRRVRLKRALVRERLFIQPSSEKSCLSGLARRKVCLWKVVYPALVGERLV